MELNFQTLIVPNYYDNIILTKKKLIFFFLNFSVYHFLEFGDVLW